MLTNGRAERTETVASIKDSVSAAEPTRWRNRLRRAERAETVVEYQGLGQYGGGIGCGERSEPKRWWNANDSVNIVLYNCIFDRSRWGEGTGKVTQYRSTKGQMWDH